MREISANLTYDSLAEYILYRAKENTQVWRVENELKLETGFLESNKWGYNIVNVQTGQYICAKPINNEGPMRPRRDSDPAGGFGLSANFTRENGKNEEVIFLDKLPEDRLVGFWWFEKNSHNDGTLDVV